MKKGTYEKGKGHLSEVKGHFPEQNKGVLLGCSKLWGALCLHWSNVSKFPKAIVSIDRITYNIWNSLPTSCLIILELPVRCIICQYVSKCFETQMLPLPRWEGVETVNWNEKRENKGQSMCMGISNNDLLRVCFKAICQVTITYLHNHGWTSSSHSRLMIILTHFNLSF